MQKRQQAIEEMAQSMAQNTNPKMIELVAKLKPDKMKDYRHVLGYNPGAINFIKLNLDMFHDVPQIYANPESFVPIVNTRLVRRIDFYLY